MELCAYESITVGESGFCGVFEDEEWLDGEYYFDVSANFCCVVARYGIGRADITFARIVMTDSIPLYDGIR